ncbi:hypothetical protein EJ02DRAFT_499389 [Clathrospora elynae]|uniref:Myb-like domain-containing protein n=1 Tax=Clathrospora elynae TaxID=706981 RepID=A0A6A5TE99_9PLEO|nr:hypothetical protein EJ02DRAFT_499389 [Clathrospora elynae]
MTSDHYDETRSRGFTPVVRSKPGAPIAQVLNNDTPTLQAPQHACSTPLGSTVPFSGRLSDLLLDSFEEGLNKRRKLEPYPARPMLAGCDNSIITLPKPPHYPRKTTGRQRIPPLLQGLHQPPPLPPQGQLFPPITSESNTFPRVVTKNIRRDDSGDTRQTILGRYIPKEVSKFGINKPLEGVEPTNENTSTPLVSPRIVVSHGQHAPWPIATKVTPKTIRTKRGKKRQMWSEAETTNLMMGVKKFGIGNWKRILHCHDYEFNGRSAVDLKDRFRVCRPGEGLKSRTHDSKECHINVPTDPTDPTDPTVKDSTLETTSTVRKQAYHTGSSMASESCGKQRHRVGSAELAELGIREPFVKSARRPRRRFSVYDDENLLRGFQKYGTIWHLIRDDKDLGFGTRHPTDLRDRFRIRYPEAYEEYTIAGRAKREEQNISGLCYQSCTGAKQSSTGADFGTDTKRMVEETLDPDAALINPFSTPSSSSKPYYFGYSLGDAVSVALTDDIDQTWGERTDDQSPITLNRNILQWADANPSSLSGLSSTSATFSTAGSSNVYPFGFSLGLEGSHTAPITTLQLPMTTTLSNGPSTFVNPLKTYTSTADDLATKNVAEPFSVTAVTTTPTQTLSNASSATLLPTPNLPILVFPRISMSSARSAVHSPPPPPMDAAIDRIEY